MRPRSPAPGRRPSGSTSARSSWSRRRRRSSPSWASTGAATARARCTSRAGSTGSPSGIRPAARRARTGGSPRRTRCTGYGRTTSFRTTPPRPSGNGARGCSPRDAGACSGSRAWPSPRRRACLARIAPAVAGTPTGRLSAAGHAVVALVCFTLTDTSLLLWGRADGRPPPGPAGVLPVALLAGLLGRGRGAGDAGGRRPPPVAGGLADGRSAARAPRDPGRARDPLPGLRGRAPSPARGPWVVPLPLSHAAARAAAPPGL